MSKEKPSLSRPEMAPADGLAVLSPLGHGLKPIGPEQPWFSMTPLTDGLGSFQATPCFGHVWGQRSTRQGTGHLGQWVFSGFQGHPCAQWVCNVGIQTHSQHSRKHITKLGPT